MSSRIIPKQRAVGVRRWDPADLSGGASPTAASTSTGSNPQAVEPPPIGDREAGIPPSTAALTAGEADRTRVAALAAAINELVADFEQSLASDVLSLSLELAKLIVRQSLRVKPELVLGVLREAIATLPGVSDQTTLKLHPADAQLLRELAEQDPALRELRWKVVEDAQIERGGCRLDTPSTEIDATLETRWRRVIAALGRDDAWFDITT